MTDEQHAPPRLLHTGGAAGDCLREVLAAQEQARVPRFAELQERRLQRMRRQRGLSVLALAAALLMAARALHREEARPSIRAELAMHAELAGTPSTPLEVAAKASPAPEPEPAREASAASPAKPEDPPPAVPKPLPARANAEAPARSNAQDQARDAAEPPRPSEDAVSGTAAACAELARDGAAEQALGCYQRLSGGSGMVAELSLFEQARLEGKVLRRPERALRTLDEYRRRFPSGSLRGEVMLAQVDWLLAAGDSARALEAVEEALASGLLRERTAELERLRATLKSAPAPEP
jgi:hypothetical protein